MEKSFFAADLLAEIPVPDKGMVSRTLQNDEHSKIILFGFAAGGGLRDHSAPMPVMLYFLKGEATLTMGDDTRTVGPGAFTHMQPGLIHAIEARTAVLMLLVLIKCAT